MTTSSIRVGIFGGSGYGGSELLRILLPHPNAEIAFVTANEQAGKPISEVHRSLHGLTDLKLCKVPEDLENLRDLDCAFLALPHGQAMEIAPISAELRHFAELQVRQTMKTSMHFANGFSSLFVSSYESNLGVRVREENAQQLRAAIARTAENSHSYTARRHHRPLT